MIIENNNIRVAIDFWAYKPKLVGIFFGNKQADMPVKKKKKKMKKKVFFALFLP
jgi:hypothetical protein